MLNHYVIALLLLIISSLAFAEQSAVKTDTGLTRSESLAAKKEDQGFSYQEQVIHPACIDQFTPTLTGDGIPVVRAINLDICQASELTAHKPITITPNGSYLYTGADGKLSYKVLGKTLNNIYVIQIASSSSDGSGVFADLLLLQLVNNYLYIPYYVNNEAARDKLRAKATTELRMLGFINGGDRCVGGIHDVKIADNVLIIRKYNGMNPVDCDESKLVQSKFDLSQLTT
jgi:hypothetical protein